MPDTQDEQPSPIEIHAARIHAASPRALREKERKWKIVSPLLKGSPAFDPKATHVGQAKKHGVSLSAVYKWLGRCERGTRSALDLLELPRGGKGKSRAISDESLREFVTVNCLQWCSTSGKATPAIAPVMRLIKDYADDYKWEIPSRYVLRRFLYSIPRTLRIYAAEGKEGLLKAMPKPPVHRAGRPNERWVTDHKEMHIRLRDTDGGKPFRPDLTAIIDRYDQCLLGFCLSRQANSITFGLALRMAMLPKEEDPEHLLMGRCDQMWTDKGNDFTGFYSEAVLQELGIEPRATIGRSPWSKGDMEGFFAVLDRMLTQFLEGHTGHRPTAKPVNQEPVYDMHEFERLLRKWCFQVYNHLPFMNRRVNGQEISRLQLRRSAQFPIHTMDAHDIDILLLPRVARTFGSRGISVGSIPYWNESDAEFLRLAAERATVEVGIDYSRRGRVLIFHNNRFCCYGYNWDAEKAGVTEADVTERLHNRSRYVKAVADVANPMMQASVDMGTYIDKVAERNARETVQIAAVAGERPRIAQILPRAASVRRGPAAVHGIRSPHEPRRPQATPIYNDPYSDPIPGTEVTE